MTLDNLVSPAVTVAVFETMAAVGLGVAVADVMAVARDGRLLARAVLANYVLVPAVTVALLMAFGAHPMVAAGFLVLAVCPGAPFGPPLAILAGGNAAVSVGLMTILAVSSAVLAPVSLCLLLPWVSAAQGLTPETVTRILLTLIGVQILPLCAGLGIRHCRPALAARLTRPANRLGKVLNAVAVALILAAHYPLLMEVKLKGFIGMLLLLAASLAAGWLLGGSGSGHRKAMALTTALRNVGVGLVIVTGAFAGTPAVTAALAYGLVGVLGSLALALYWSRQPGSLSV